MTLLPADRRQLHAALSDAFRTANALNNLTLLGLGVDLQTITPPQARPAMVLEIIKFAEQGDNVVALIQAAIQANPTNAGLRAYGTDIVDRLKAADATTWYPRPADPFESCFIEPGPQPFISRPILRQFLQGLGTPGGFPVLVVNGLSKTGKSYSFLFIGYLKRVLAAYDVAWVDLKDEVYAEYKPESLAYDIGMSLNWDLATLPKRPSTRFTKELTRWMLGQASRGQNPVVVVLDGFHKPELFGETRDLVQDVIKQVAANTSRIRLVLLNYGEDLLPPGLPPIQKEPLTLLTRPEVVNFFQKIAQQQGQNPDLAAIEDVVNRVMAEVPASDPSYNELLNQKVTEAAQLLLQGG
jgi:hypothetical protein